MGSNKTHIKYYLKTPLVKMGKWACLPADSDTWHNIEVSNYHFQAFGIPKGLLTLHTLEDGYQHMYVPKEYLAKLGRYINALTSKNIYALSNILKSYYPLVAQAKKEVLKKFPVITNKTPLSELTTYYKLNREWVHRVTVFDQFAWLAEEYLNKRVEHILEHELNIPKNSLDFKEVFFKLTKPENISTTLLEKLAVLKLSLKVKEGKTTLTGAAKALAKKFGWLPVFVFGENWDASHYTEELEQQTNLSSKRLETEIHNLENYKLFRQQDIRNLKQKYKITPAQLQTCVDFGLAIDTRNEAEYFVSYAGQFLMPLYKEFANFLSISLRQLRTLTEKEILTCIKQPHKVHKFLNTKRKYVGWGFNKNIQKQIYFTEKETEKLFTKLEKTTPYLQGSHESMGVCASPGKVTGIARIIPNPGHNHKVKMGDILITYATTTDYLPAMKRAKAIITEVGGMTCHAAVVSREFNIPCIVSLKNAMKNIPDGSKIEVDATNGTVKII